MYKDFREFHSLDNGPCKDLKDNDVTDRELDSALGGGIDKHRDELLKDWEHKFQAFGEDPIEREPHALNQQTPPICPQEKGNIPASFDSTVSIQNDQAMVNPKSGQRSGDNPVVVHAALVDLWTEIQWYENWEWLGVIAFPWEIRLPHETVTDMLLPNRKTIEAIEVEGLLIGVVRRGMGGRTLTMAIEVPQQANNVFSMPQKKFVRDFWKCIVKWIITVSKGAIIEWETWRFLWRHNLYPPMGCSLTENDVWGELAHTGELIRRQVRKVMTEETIPMPKAIRRCEESLAVAGRLNASMSNELADVVSSSLLAGYSKADLTRLINKIHFMGRKYARPGTRLEKPDPFFMFATFSIYNLAQRNLENEDEGSRQFPLAKMLYSRILSSVGDQTS